MPREVCGSKTVAATRALLPDQHAWACRAASCGLLPSCSARNMSFTALHAPPSAQRCCWGDRGAPPVQICVQAPWLVAQLACSCSIETRLVLVAAGQCPAAAHGPPGRDSPRAFAAGRRRAFAAAAAAAMPKRGPVLALHTSLVLCAASFLVGRFLQPDAAPRPPAPVQVWWCVARAADRRRATQPPPPPTTRPMKPLHVPQCPAGHQGCASAGPAAGAAAAAAGAIWRRRRPPRPAATRGARALCPHRERAAQAAAPPHACPVGAAAVCGAALPGTRNAPPSAWPSTHKGRHRLPSARGPAPLASPPARQPPPKAPLPTPRPPKSSTNLHIVPTPARPPSPQILSWYPRIVVYPNFIDAQRAQHIITLAKARLSSSDLAYRQAQPPAAGCWRPPSAGRATAGT